jgi:hypothetical protein
MLTAWRRSSELKQARKSIKLSLLSYPTTRPIDHAQSSVPCVFTLRLLTFQRDLGRAIRENRQSLRAIVRSACDQRSGAQRGFEPPGLDSKGLGHSVRSAIPQKCAQSQQWLVLDADCCSCECSCLICVTQYLRHSLAGHVPLSALSTHLHIVAASAWWQNCDTVATMLTGQVVL